MDEARAWLRTAAAVVGVGLLVLAVADPALVVFRGGNESAPPQKSLEDVKLVRPVENGSHQLWPYTSRRKAFGTVTLPINVVVHEDAATVRRMLAGQAATDWDSGVKEEPTNGTDGRIRIGNTTIPWKRSHGGTRYTYVVDGRGWMDATYQLEDGHYFGVRYHLRLYAGASGDGAWTAIQAHREHWDWFRLRHTVHSVSEGQWHVEQDFYGEPFLRDVSRERYANGGAIDANGWVTVIDISDVQNVPTPDESSSSRTAVTSPSVPGRGDGAVPPRAPRRAPPAGFVPALALAFLVGIASTAPTRVIESVEVLERWMRDHPARPRHAGLFVGVAAVPLVARRGAIAVEQAFPRAGPVVVGGPFYLLLVLGLPAVAALGGRTLDPREAYGVAAAGAGAGFLADYATLGVVAVRTSTLLHRGGALLALGLVAAGAARYDRDRRSRTLVAGLLAWVLVVTWPLLGL